jgi:hypothetical protein
MKKLLLLFALFISLTLEVYAQDALYFENFESIVFKNKDGMKTLTFSVNNDSGLSKIVIIKQKPDEYVFSVIRNGNISEPIVTDEENIRSTMPMIIKNYLDKYKVKLKDINRIVNKIY